ncbi:MAG TPA: hypothetical protein VF092_14170 [Longimicrobium sp.]
MTSPVPLTPPTDNLYKFMAIAGLAIVAASFGFGVAATHDFRTAQWQLDDDEANLAFEVQRASLAIGGGVVLDRTRHAVLAPPEITRRINADSALRERFEALVRQAAEVRRKSERVEQLYREFGRVLHLAEVANLCGCGFTLLGFALWYFKFQRYQDELLRLQVAGAKAAQKGADGT